MVDANRPALSSILHTEEHPTQSQLSPPSAQRDTKIRRRNRMITSCLECRRRKLKCNKAQPCVNCTKAGRECLFLAPALDSISQFKLTQIKEKVGSLERLLEQDIARSSHESRHHDLIKREDEEDEDEFPYPEDERQLEPSPMAVKDAAYGEPIDDDVYDLGIQFGKLRMNERIGGLFRPRLTEEIDAALSDARADQRPPQEKIMSPENHLPTETMEEFIKPGPSYIGPSSSFFFAAAGAESSLIDYLPSRTVADRLLRQYFEAVHIIARAVHRPTFLRQYDRFWADVALGIEPPASLQALVFSALLSGAASMKDDLVLSELGITKASLVDNFRLGVEMALSRANFLRSTKLDTLQALVMYLIPLCRDQVSRAHSALVGTATRIAQCMGLHRDGTNYGLSPVETHVRRIIWWQICFLDVRTCEAQGPGTMIREDEHDTQFPVNIHDVDLENPNFIKPDLEEWTDMTFSLIRFECTKVHQSIWNGRSRVGPKKASLTATVGKTESFRKMMEGKYGSILDKHLPIRRAARYVMDIMISRLHIAVLHPYLISVQYRIPDRLRQVILTNGTHMIECAIQLETDPDLAFWSWYTGAYQQYHTAFLLLTEVFFFPKRKEADRIWKCCDYIFETNPAHTREEKARIILATIRNRTYAYRELRKVRAPTGMEARIGISPPRQPGQAGPQGQGHMQNLDVLYGVTRLGADDSSDPNSGEKLTAYPPPPPSPLSMASVPQEASSESPEYYPKPQGQASVSPVPMTQELMADIDWNEWDRLFPQQSSSEELDLPEASEP